MFIEIGHQRQMQDAAGTPPVKPISKTELVKASNTVVTGIENELNKFLTEYINKEAVETAKSGNNFFAKMAVGILGDKVAENSEQAKAAKEENRTKISNFITIIKADIQADLPENATAEEAKEYINSKLGFLDPSAKKADNSDFTLDERKEAFKNYLIYGAKKFASTNPTEFSAMGINVGKLEDEAKDPNSNISKLATGFFDSGNLTALSGTFSGIYTALDATATANIAAAAAPAATTVGATPIPPTPSALELAEAAAREEKKRIKDEQDQKEKEKPSGIWRIILGLLEKFAPGLASMLEGFGLGGKKETAAQNENEAADKRESSASERKNDLDTTSAAPRTSLAAVNFDGVNFGGVKLNSHNVDITKPFSPTANGHGLLREERHEVAV